MLTKIEIKIALMEAEVALHRLRPVVNNVLEQTHYDEIQEVYKEYVYAFDRIQCALRDVGCI